MEKCDFKIETELFQQMLQRLEQSASEVNISVNAMLSSTAATLQDVYYFCLAYNSK
jgi:hypothetical protein